MNGNKFSGLSLTVIALLLVAIVGTGVYAYYASGSTGTATVTTSEYIVKVNNADSVGNGEFVITLNGEGSDDDVIAPGEYVAVPITIDTTGSDVNVTYSVQAAYTSDAATAQITNLKICKTQPAVDGTCTNAVEFNGTTNVSIYEDVALSKNATANPVIYLTWAYGDENSVDADNADQNDTASIVFTVDAEQVLVGIDNQIRG